jgi:hypothetical protein
LVGWSPPLHSAGCGRSRGAHRTHSSPIPPLLVCGAGATCGVAGGWGGLACTGGSTACDGGTLRWRAGATCGVAQPSGLHWWLGRLRWRRITLAEVRILRFAICDELQIDLWQRAASPARLRHSPHDGRDAIHKKAPAGPGTALHKSRLLASCPDFGAGPLAWGRLHGDSRTQTDTTKERAPDAVTTRSDWPPGPCYDPASHRPRH